jgi:hypothetical protein
MKRYIEAIKNRELDAKHFIAINIGDSPKAIKKYLQQKRPPFPIYLDRQRTLMRTFHLNATPFVVHIDTTGKAVWISTGFSPLGIIKAKELLQQ